MSQLDRLPTELITELALFLPVDDLAKLVDRTPGLCRLSDGNHRFWRDRYRREISTYPSIEISYKEAYFSRHKALSNHPTVTHQLLRMAELGYDSALKLIPLPSIDVVLYATATKAITGGYSSIVEHIITHAPFKNDADFTYVLQHTLLAAAIMGQRDLVEWLLNHNRTGSNDVYTWNLLDHAVRSGNVSLAKYVNSMGKCYDPSPFTLGHLATAAIEGRPDSSHTRLPMVKWVISLYPPHWTPDYDGLCKSAESNGVPDLIPYIWSLH